MTNLLTRLAKDFPQLILYSVIFGITDDSKMRRLKSHDEDAYQRKSLSSPTSNEDEFDQDEVDDETQAHPHPPSIYSYQEHSIFYPPSV